ncbi:hypothetical protein JCM10213_001671 [Rhodosporidiobolus nylandii]
MASSTSPTHPLDPLPRSYFLFFTVLEPFLTILGSLYAIFRPATYFSSLFPPTLAPPPMEDHPASLMAVRQLGSCFFLFAILGATLLRVVNRESEPKAVEKVTRVYLACLAAADLTHIGFTLFDLGLTGTLSPFEHWNQLVFGNVVITAALFAVRMMWFTGVGRDVVREEGKERRE